MKTCIISVLWGLALFPFSLSCRGVTEAEINETLAIIRTNETLGIIHSNHLGRFSLAYRSVAAEKMLAEANYFSKKLSLPMPHPLRISDVAIHPSSPLNSIEGGSILSLTNKAHPAKFVVSGNMDTTNFSFYYTEGYLWTVGWGVNSGMKYDEHAPSLIDTNGAYRLATQWLAAVEVDVAALEKKYRPNVAQRWYIRPGLGTGDTNIIAAPRNPATGDIDYASVGATNKILLPTFEVTWGGDVARVKVLGTRKELMELHLGDLSLSRRPQLVITNALELNNIPDPPVINRLRRPLPGPATTNAPAQ